MATTKASDAMDEYEGREHTPRWFCEALERFVAAGTITPEQAAAACPRRPAA